MLTKTQIVQNRRLLVAGLLFSQIILYNWTYSPDAGLAGAGFSFRVFPIFKLSIVTDEGFPFDTSFIGYILFATFLYRNRIQLKETNNALFTSSLVICFLGLLKNVINLPFGPYVYPFHFEIKMGLIMTLLCFVLNNKMEKKMEEEKVV